ncbi:thioredoxin domain-containing protein [Patescibacteria group bacterium]|nr:thioredoxin domain-containing protein [Patescibacteria group bacterium]
MNTKVIIIVAAVLCAALIGGGIYFAVRPQPTGPRQVPISASYTDRVKAGGWTRGTTHPQVTVVEYGDFQCPACYNYFPIVERSYADTKDIAQFVFRQYPLQQHNKAMQAAKAAEAAGRQGKFWEMYNLLYTKQPEWADDTTFSFGSRLSDYAGSLGLNADQFNADMNDPSIEDEISKDVAKGNQVPLTGTPTIVIDGTVLSNLPATSDALTALIRQAAQRATPSPTQ